MEPERETYLFLTKGLAEPGPVAGLDFYGWAEMLSLGCFRRFFLSFAEGSWNSGHRPHAVGILSRLRTGVFSEGWALSQRAVLGAPRQNGAGLGRRDGAGEGLFQAPHLTVLTLRRIHRLLKPAKGPGESC